MIEYKVKAKQKNSQKLLSQSDFVVCICVFAFFKNPVLSEDKLVGMSVGGVLFMPDWI